MKNWRSRSVVSTISFQLSYQKFWQQSKFFCRLMFVLRLLKEYEAKVKEHEYPLAYTSYLRLQVLCQTFYDADDKLHILDDLSISDLKSFIPELCSQVYIEGLCHGNMLEEEAISLSNIFKMNFSVQPLPIELRHKECVVCFPPGANLIRDASVKNKSETNSVTELHFQIEQEVGIRLNAMTDLFVEIIWEPLYNQLRTKEQLGYSVECGPRITHCVFGFCFCVQSSKYNPMYIQERVDKFINGLEELLEGLGGESFERYRSGLMAKLLEKVPSLTYETNRYWNQIIDKRYIFGDLRKKEAEELRSIDKEDVINWYKMYFQQSSPKCRRLAIRVWGCNTEAQSESTQIIEDPATFKMSSRFYPSIC